MAAEPTARDSHVPAPTNSEFRFRHEVDVRFRDLDPMGHAHHTLALIYIEEARTEYWRSVLGRKELDFIMGEVSVTYHRRILYPARLSVGVRISRLGGSSFDMEYEIRTDAGELVAGGRSRSVLFDYSAGRPRKIPDDMRGKVEAWDGPLSPGSL